MPYPATVDLFPKTLLGRVCAALAAVAIIVVAVFFLTIALAIAGVALAVAVVRVMWLSHKARRHGPPRADDEAIEVEYTVVEEREPPDQSKRKP